jgi:LytR cell envelope-related transcriptional attenuator
VTAPRGGGGTTRGSNVSAGARGAIVVGLAVILGIVGLQILDDSGPSSGDASVTTTVPGATSGGSTSTTVALREAGAVRVKVYNASGVQGTAQTMTDKLKAQGYNMQTPANLSSERSGTVVECIEGFQREGTLLAGYGIGNGATIQPYPKDPPEGASDADCIVIIGTA